MPGHVVNREVSLILSERMRFAPSESLSVKDQNENELFKIHGSKLSPTGKRTITDARTGTELYRVKEPMVSMRETRKIEDAQTGEIVFTMHKKGMVAGSHTVLVWRGSSDSGDAVYSINGGLLEKEFNIQIPSTHQPVAEVRKQSFNMRNLLM